MAELIEDQELGMVQGAKAPDMPAIASDLQSNGVTRGQVEKAAEGLPVSRQAMSELLSQFPDDGYDDMFSSTDVFTDGLLISETSYINERTATEAAFVKGLSRVSFSPELQGEIDSLAMEHQNSGSIDVQEFTEQNVQAAKESFVSLDMTGDQALEGVQEQIDVEQGKPEVLTMYEELVEELRAQGISEKALPLVTVSLGMYRRRQLEDILRAASDQEIKDSSLPEVIGDFAEVFVDTFGVLERAQRREVVNTLDKSKGDLIEYNFYRSSDIMEIMDGFDDLPFKDQVQFVNRAIEASREADTMVGNHNSLLSSSLLLEMAEATRDDYGREDWISWAEAAGIVGVKPFLSGVRSLAKALTVKTLKFRDAYYGLDVADDLVDVDRAIDEFIKNFDPDNAEATTLSIYKEKVQPTSKTGRTKGKSKRQNTYTAIRMGNNRVGNVTQSIAPETLRRVMQTSKSNGTLPKTLKTLGLDEDVVTLSSTAKMPNEIQEGINPRVVLQNDTIPTNTEITGTKSAVELFQERPLGLTLSKNEIQSAPKRRFSRVETLSGKSLSLHAEKVDIIGEESSVTFLGRFGVTDESGFGSYDDAATAAGNLIGEEFNIVVKNPNEDTFTSVTGNVDVPTEYFVEVPSTRQYLPQDGTQFLDGSTWYSPNAVSKMFLTSTDRISKDIVSDFSYLKDWNLGVVQRLRNTLKPYADLFGGNRAAVNSLLEIGDSRQVEHTLESASEMLGRPLTPDSRVWKGYQAARQYYNDLADINDTRVRSEMESKGYKSVQIKDEYGNNVYGRPMTYDELAGTDAKQIYNVETEMMHSVEGIQESAELVPVQLNRVLDKPEGSFSIVLRSRENIAPLPQRVIPRRRGYVNLAYSDVGAIVKLSYPRTVNGVAKSDGGTEVLRFARTSKEADAFLNATPKGSTKTNRELLLEDAPDGAEIVTSESREHLFELADVEIKGDGTALPYNLRGRKENPIETTRGTVEVLEMEERIGKSMTSMENTLNRDGINLMKKRFVSQYGAYLKEPGRFPDNKDLAPQFRVSGKTGILADEQTRKNMANIHNYILDMERMFNGRKDSALQSQIDRILQNLGVTSGKFDVLSNIRSLASFIVIYGRPLYQIIGNSAQMLTLTQRDPLRGAASIAQTALAAPAIGYRLKGGKTVDWNMYAKLAGFDSGKDLTDWIDGIEKVGAFSAAQIDNLLSNLDSSRKMQARSYTKRNLKFMVDSPRLAQAVATDIANLAAYRHAVKLTKEKFPALNPYQGQGLKKTQESFRDLTFRMDKSDVLLSETDPLMSLVFLWTQHVYKGFKDTIVQPGVRALTGKTLSKNPSLWADSWGQAFTSTAMTMAMFGTAGFIGSDAVLDLDEFARKSGVLDEGEALPEVFMEGIFDMMFKATVGTDVNIAERISFGDAPQMMLTLSGIAEDGLNLLGGGTVAFTRLGQLYDTARVMMNTPIASEQDMNEMLEFIGSEVAGVFSGVKDWEKAALAKNLGIYFSSSGNPLYSVDPEIEVGAMFSFRPDDAALRERILFDKKGSKEEQNFYLDTIPKTFARWYWKNINDLAEKQELNFKTYNAELQKFLGLVDAATGNTGATRLSYEAKQKFMNLAIDPRGVFKDAELNGKNKALVDKLLDNYSFSEAKAKLEQIITLADDENLKQTAETMLESLKLQEQILTGENDG